MVTIEKQELKRSYDLEFLPQKNKRIICLMWELLEPQSKLQMQNTDRTIVFFDRLEFDSQWNLFLTRASVSGTTKRESRGPEDNWAPPRRIQLTMKKQLKQRDYWLSNLRR